MTTCEYCRHWQPNGPAAYYGTCAAGAAYGQVAFNDGKDCPAFEALQPLAVPDAIALQSAARGMTMQEWQERLGVKKA